MAGSQKHIIRRVETHMFEIYSDKDLNTGKLTT